MIIPPLERSSRKWEYNKYTAEQHVAVVKAFLFDGKTHRQIDNDVLCLDSESSLGFQSMGVLHYLGLVGSFKGLFSGMSTEKAIEELVNTNKPEYYELISILQETEISETICENDIETETSENYEVEKEGKRIEYFTTKYERNPKNRKWAIHIHGTKCMACGFDFELVYGARGKGYIEIHHIVPLADKNEETEVNPATDLIVVCANCHRMIHRKKNEVLTLKELKDIINK